MPGVESRIVIRPDICHGQACVLGTRIPVSQILDMLAAGDDAETLLKEFPSLEIDDIYACLRYAARLAEEQMTPLDAFGD